MLTNQNGLGVGQNWQNIPTRVMGTTYTNTSGKPIEVYISFVDVTNVFSCFVNGVSIAYTGGQTVGFVVPNGQTYLIDPNGASTMVWSELR